MTKEELLKQVYSMSRLLPFTYYKIDELCKEKYGVYPNKLDYASLNDFKWYLNRISHEFIKSETTWKQNDNPSFDPDRD